MAKFEIKLIGRLDESGTLNNIQSQVNDVAKKVKDIKVNLKAEGIQQVQAFTKNVTAEIKELGRQNKFVADQASRNIRDQIVLNGQLANSTKAARSVDYNKLQELLVQRRNLISNMNSELVQNQKVTESARNYRLQIEQINRRIAEQKTQINVLEKSSLSFWDRLTTKAKEYFNYAIAAMALQQAGNFIGNMIEEVKGLDASLVELRKVTDLEGDSLDNFISKAYEASRAVAKTGQDMIDASTEFAKSGYDSDMALELGKIALMYGNVADEAITAGESANFIIAQMKAFGIEAENAIHIIDAVNEVSNNFAVSSADIANNMGKASAVIANAGNSMEQYIGMMTAITEITRSADKAANGLKTITLRLQGMNDEGEKDLDVQAKMEAMFQKLGLSVYDANGQLKNTYDILNTLAPVYQTLTNAEKAYVTETIAGKFQAQNAAAALNNWSTAVKATETAVNSQGSAMAENEKVLDSIEGKINALSSAFQELATTMISSDLIKGVTDLGIVLLEVANSGFGQFIIKSALTFTALRVGVPIIAKGVSTFKNLFTTIKTGSGVFTLLSMAIKSNEKIQISALNTEKADITAQQIKQTLLKKGLTVKQADVAVEKLREAATKGQTTATMAQVAAQSLLNIALGAASIALMAGFSIYQKYKQEQQEMINNTINAASELEQQNNEIDDTISRIEELRAVTDDSTSSYEDAGAAREELIKIQKDLSDRYGIEKDSIDLVTGSIDEQIKKLKELKRQRAEDYINDNRTSYNTAYKEVYGNNPHSRNMDIGFGTMSGMAGSGTKDKSKINWYLGTPPVNASEEFLKEKEAFEKYYNDYKNIMKKYGEIKESVRNTDGSVSDVSFTTKNVDSSKKALEEWKKYLLENEKQLINSGIVTQESFNNALKKVDTDLNKINTTFGDSYTVLTQYQEQLMYAKGYEQFKEGLVGLQQEGTVTAEAVRKLLGNFPELENALKENGITVDQLVKEYQNIPSAINDVINGGTDELVGQLKDMVTANDFTEESINKLKEAFPELEGQLSATGVSFEQFLNYLKNLKEGFSDLDSYVHSFANGAKTSEDAIAYLNNVVNEFNNDGKISSSVLSELASKTITLADGTTASYLSFLNFTENGVKANTDALYGNIDALRLKAIADIQESAAMQIMQLVASDTNKTVDETGDSVKSTADKLAESLKQDADKISSNIKVGASYEYVKQAAEGKGLDTSNWEKNQGEIEKIINQAGNNIKALDSYYKSIGKTTAAKSNSSSAKKEKEWWETELQAIQNQFKYNEITISEYIAKLNNLRGKLAEGSDAWKKINEELQKQRLSKVEADFKAGRISLEEYIRQLRSLIGVYREGTEAWNALADKIKKGLQDLANQTKSAYDDAKQAVDSVIDDEISKIDDKINALQKANDEQEREIELQRLKDALENARNNKTKRVWTGSEWKWTADQGAIDDAQKALDDFEKENAILELEKQKEALQDLKNAYKDVTNEFQKEQERQALIAMLGADAEKKILEDRLGTLAEFRDKYLKIQQEIANYDKATPESLAGGSTSNTQQGANSDSGGGQSGSLSQSDIDRLAREVISGKYGNGQARKNALGDKYSVVQKRVNQMLGIKGYADGGIVDYTGLAMLHGTKSKPEIVMNYEQIKKLVASTSQPQTEKKVENKTQNHIYQFSGDFNLPGVKNASDFIRELQAKVNISRHSV